MIVYRGDAKNNFEIRTWLNSRYGLPVLFFTTNPQLARLYAIWHARQMGKTHKGSLYMCEINDLWIYKYDFGGKDTYGAEFRNLIYTFRNFNHKAVLLQNALDYPCKDLIRYETSDILAVYDFDIIKNLQIVENKVLQT